REGPPSGRVGTEPAGSAGPVLREERVISLSRVTTLVALTALTAGATKAAGQNSAERAYFQAGAPYFGMPAAEGGILGACGRRADEVPVGILLAGRAGVSAEALVALREAGHSWTALAERYGVGAHTRHVPLRDPASAGTYRALYERFQSTPVSQWNDIRL